MESFWFFGPAIGDEFERREPLQGLQAPGMVVGVEKDLQVQSEAIVAVIGVPLDGRLFEGAVHALDLPLVQG